jgi:phage tail sheath protein FI
MPGDRLCIGFGTWVNYPGDAKGQINTIPFGGMEMGLIAKVDRMNDASLVAAGANAISKRALGLAQNYSDADRFALNAAGVSLGRYLYKNVRTYGYRTVAGPNETNWLFFQESRVIMNIAHAVQAQVEEYVFNSVDGRQTLFTRIKNACTGVLIPFFQAGALFGATPDQSFRVVCDARNNTDETIAAGEVHVTLYLRTSKVAEWIKVNIIKVPTDQEVPAA